MRGLLGGLDSQVWRADMQTFLSTHVAFQDAHALTRIEMDKLRCHGGYFKHRKVVWRHPAKPAGQKYDIDCQRQVAHKGVWWRAIKWVSRGWDSNGSHDTTIVPLSKLR